VVAIAVSDARSAVLQRIQEALADVPSDEPPAATPAAPVTTVADPLALFLERVVDYGADAVALDDERGLADAVGAALARHGAADVVVPADLPPTWVPPSLSAVRDEPALSREAIESADAVVSACALAIAETGTVVLDHAVGQGRRVLTLLPDLHVCVVREAQVFGSVAEAVAALADRTGPLTLISGPSATSDIELARVEGVHGPRVMHVIVVRASPSKGAVVGRNRARDDARGIRAGE
jgi:L-lactate dehydrogenase complex protein LldG